MMATRIYAKIADDTVGNADLEAYAAFLRAELGRLYPEAAIEIETTTTESGVLPCVIEAETAAERDEIAREISALWDRYCQQG
jgi:hypothetical protein